MEQHLSYSAQSVYSKEWATVMHIGNGTNEMDWALGHNASNPYYDYVAKNVDPFNEFHTFGLDWQEDGCRYYFDGELTQATTGANGSANYKMLHLWSLYFGKVKYYNPSEGGFGPDSGVYPKEVLVDYFRVWKNVSVKGQSYTVQLCAIWP